MTRPAAIAPRGIRRLSSGSLALVLLFLVSLPAVTPRIYASDEIQFFVAPVAVGGGKRALPDGVRVPLELLDERRFGGGMVFLRYRVA